MVSGMIVTPGRRNVPHGAAHAANAISRDITARVAPNALIVDHGVTEITNQSSAKRKLKHIV